MQGRGRRRDDDQAAPSNLTPNPATPAADVPEAWKDGCHLDYLVVAETKPCVFGDPNGTQTAVLFGDSHMDQWEPAFAAAGAQLHWKIINWTKAACPAADITVVATTLNRPYTECDTWRQQTIDRIAALKPDDGLRRRIREPAGRRRRSPPRPGSTGRSRP